ncbi:LytR/AlgR family response regulator transcription factor [Cyclobacterium qasimii]|uniref:Two-component system response regulator n=2 Tax=Cyclobacterium qasimii TaxID=1350429 RepID=S7WNE6_9BACT|nr:LytTR family DNA-binding domain-containing protein [Cyclobacterium qasimii]EPR68234.1 Two-component system response regulator [Cyclobacterium qasimii M12-11B]GEO19809.1 DNA-binding response regulator [Cyclobacterium qasimii]
MNCIIIEDQPPAQRILKKYIDDLGTLKLKGTFSDPILAMEFLNSNAIDLIFLDIHLPRLTGLDLLKSLSIKPHIILTTAYSEYALESYDLDVVDYLLKPFSFLRFVKAVSKVPGPKEVNPAERVSFKANSNHKKEHFIKLGYDHVRISFEDIMYIRADGDYCDIILSDKKYISSEPMKKWLELLDGQQFIRIHKSFMVNIARIEKVSGNLITLINGEQLPIGRAFKEGFSERFLK